jgi:hypothetical protein
MMNDPMSVFSSPLSAQIASLGGGLIPPQHPAGPSERQLLYVVVGIERYGPGFIRGLYDMLQQHSVPDLQETVSHYYQEIMCQIFDHMSGNLPYFDSYLKSLPNPDCLKYGHALLGTEAWVKLCQPLTYQLGLGIFHELLAHKLLNGLEFPYILNHAAADYIVLQKSD